MLLSYLIETAINATHPTDRAAAARKAFVEIGGFAAANQSRIAKGDEPFTRVAEVPMWTVMKVVRPMIEAHRDQQTAAALVATEVVLVPVDQAPRRRGQRGGRRHAAKPQAVPRAPAERTLAQGERWCNACPRRHVFNQQDGRVPPLVELRKRFQDGPPTREQLLEISGCGATARDGWFPLDVAVEGIRQRAADRQARAEREAEREARQLETTVGGKAGRILASATRRAAAAPKTSSAPAKPREERVVGDGTLQGGLAALRLAK